MNNDKKINNIIEALSKHEDNSAIEVLEELGTNCSDDEIRGMTAKALVNRNSEESLAVVIAQSGKGINDLSTNVAMSTINQLLALGNKETALKVLEQTEASNEDERVRETARSVKALMAFS